MADAGRRTIFLQVSGQVFAEAWRGNPVRLGEKIDARPGDMVVFVEWRPDTSAVTGREVQGRCEVEVAGRAGTYKHLAPVLRWELTSKK